MIAGTAKGRHLKTLEGYATRPTADRVRESMFNILGQTLHGEMFIDLFAGSGAVGIEALSRGVKGCVFIDSAPEACKIIRHNVETLGFTTRAEIYCREVAGAIEIAARKSRLFDYVFADPPYGKGLAQHALRQIAEANLVSSQGVCIVEHSKRETLPPAIGRLSLTRAQVYGDTVLSFYHHTPAMEG